ncbi:hypothetical protein RF11_10019 [Thelohanellus kitauei]|uniref:Uncharacterized protein n=1 Tax=Thelohanellus kitauei TaxID=669202 RepID=A0A0C2J3A5_THEKT|nr:hypothetical protein RF11_10019 [Thelohanellus kitauei]
MVRYGRVRNTSILLYGLIQVLCILALSTAYNGYLHTKLHIDCLKDTKSSVTLEFLITYPYHTNISYRFPVCGQKESSSVSQIIRQGVLIRFVMCSAFFGLFFCIGMILSYIKLKIYDVDMYVIFGKGLAIEMVANAILALLFFISSIFTTVIWVNIKSIANKSYLSTPLLYCQQNFEYMTCKVEFTQRLSTFIVSVISMMISSTLCVARLVNLLYMAQNRRQTLLATYLTVV